MNPKAFLLDSSALMTLLENEAGAERVNEIIRHERCLLPWTSILEVTYISRREQGQAYSDYRYALMKQFPVEIIWDMDEPILVKAARFKADFSISFADSIIAAYAFQNHAILLHNDPEFEPLGRQIELEALPYK
jgi:predicted nucleic acid-binding protein